MNSNNILSNAPRFFIYKITNLINNMIYVGMHTCVCKECKYMGSGKWIKSVIKKYGKENFKKEILFEYDNEKEMIEKEIEIINEEFISREDTYNLTLGGKGWSYRMVAVKLKEDNSKKPKCFVVFKNDLDYINGTYIPYTKNIKGWNEGQKNPMYGKKHSDETRKKIGVKNKTLNEDSVFLEKKRIIKKAWWESLSEDEYNEYCKNMKESVSGEKNGMYGKKHSDETRKKIGEKSGLGRLGKKRGKYKRKQS